MEVDSTSSSPPKSSNDETVKEPAVVVDHQNDAAVKEKEQQQQNEIANEDSNKSDEPASSSDGKQKEEEGNSESKTNAVAGLNVVDVNANGEEGEGAKEHKPEAQSEQEPPKEKPLTISPALLSNEQRSDVFLPLLRSNDKSLRELSLRNTQVTRPTLGMIGEALRGNRSLQYLDLSDNDLTDDDLNIFITSCLKDNVGLMRLNLSGNSKLTTKTIDRLLEVIRYDHDSLTVIDTEGTQIKEDDAKAFAEMATLNRFPADFKQQVFRAMRNDPELFKIQLVYDKSDPKVLNEIGIATLARALTHTITPEEEAFEKNRRPQPVLCGKEDDADAEEERKMIDRITNENGSVKVRPASTKFQRDLLKKSPMCNNTVRTLRLDDRCCRGERCVEALVPAIATNPNIKVLGLSNNFLGDESVRMLCNAIRQIGDKCGLEELDFGYNEITDEGVKLFIDCVAKNTSLRSIILTGNKHELTPTLLDQLQQGTALNCEPSAMKAAIEKIKKGYPKNMTREEERECYIRQNSGEFMDERGILHLEGTDSDAGKGPSKGYFTSLGCATVAAALPTNITIHTIHFQNNHIGPEGAKALAEVLEYNPTLARIDLRNNPITDEGARRLLTALKTNDALVSLDLTENCQVSTRLLDEIAAITHLNRQPVPIKQFIQYPCGKAPADGILNFRRKDVQVRGKWKSLFPQSMQYVLTILASQPHATVLDLSDNDTLGDEGVMLLIDWIKDPRCGLKRLDISNTNISSSTAEAITAALRSNYSLTSVVVAANRDVLTKPRQIMEDALSLNTFPPGVKDIAPLLKEDIDGINGIIFTRESDAYYKNHKLPIPPPIGDDAARVLFQAVMENTHVTRITLQNQQISNRGLQYAAQCLDVNSFITEVNFSHNMIGVDGIMEFAEILERNTSLTSVDLSFNPSIGVEGGNRLLLAMQTANRSIRFINLEGCRIREETKKQIEALASFNTQSSSFRHLVLDRIISTRTVYYRGGIDNSEFSIKKNAKNNAISITNSLANNGLAVDISGLSPQEAILAVLPPSSVGPQPETYVGVFGANNNNLTPDFLGDDAIDALLMALESYPKHNVRSIQLPNNHITDKGLRKLLLLLHKHQSIVDIDLINNPLTDSVVREITAFLATHTHVKRFVVGNEETVLPTANLAAAENQQKPKKIIDPGSQKHTTAFKQAASKGEEEDAEDDSGNNGGEEGKSAPTATASAAATALLLGDESNGYPIDTFGLLAPIGTIAGAYHHASSPSSSAFTGTSSPASPSPLPLSTSAHAANAIASVLHHPAFAGCMLSNAHTAGVGAAATSQEGSTPHVGSAATTDNDQGMKGSGVGGGVAAAVTTTSSPPTVLSTLKHTTGKLVAVDERIPTNVSAAPTTTSNNSKHAPSPPVSTTAATADIVAKCYMSPLGIRHINVAVALNKHCTETFRRAYYRLSQQLLKWCEVKSHAEKMQSARVIGVGGNREARETLRTASGEDNVGTASLLEGNNSGIGGGEVQYDPIAAGIMRECEEAFLTEKKAAMLATTTAANNNGSQRDHRTPLSNNKNIAFYNNNNTTTTTTATTGSATTANRRLSAAAAGSLGASKTAVVGGSSSGATAVSIQQITSRKDLVQLVAAAAPEVIQFNTSKCDLGLLELKLLFNLLTRPLEGIILNQQQLLGHGIDFRLGGDDANIGGTAAGGSAAAAATAAAENATATRHAFSASAATQRQLQLQHQQQQLSHGNGGAANPFGPSTPFITLPPALPVAITPSVATIRDGDLLMRHVRGISLANNRKISDACVEVVVKEYLMPIMEINNSIGGDKTDKNATSPPHTNKKAPLSPLFLQALILDGCGINGSCLRTIYDLCAASSNLVVIGLENTTLVNVMDRVKMEDEAAAEEKEKKRKALEEERRSGGHIIAATSDDAYRNAIIAGGEEAREKYRREQLEAQLFSADADDNGNSNAKEGAVVEVEGEKETAQKKKKKKKKADEASAEALASAAGSLKKSGGDASAEHQDDSGAAEDEEQRLQRLMLRPLREIDDPEELRDVLASYAYGKEKISNLLAANRNRMVGLASDELFAAAHQQQQQGLVPFHRHASSSSAGANTTNANDNNTSSSSAHRSVFRGMLGPNAPTTAAAAVAGGNGEALNPKPLLSNAKANAPTTTTTTTAGSTTNQSGINNTTTVTNNTTAAASSSFAASHLATSLQYARSHQEAIPVTYDDFKQSEDSIFRDAISAAPQKRFHSSADHIRSLYGGGGGGGSDVVGQGQQAGGGVYDDAYADASRAESLYALAGYPSRQQQQAKRDVVLPKASSIAVNYYDYDRNNKGSSNPPAAAANNSQLISGGGGGSVKKLAAGETYTTVRQ